MQDECRAVRDLAAARGLTLGTGESLTGGLLMAFLTRRPGATATCRAGAVVYADAAKRAVLGVSEGTLRDHGNVSEACVKEMAAGVVARLGADVGLATTGFAGPSGERVGEVWVAVAVARPSGVLVEARQHVFSGADRDSIREGACRLCLNLAQEVLERVPVPEKMAAALETAGASATAAAAPETSP